MRAQASRGGWTSKKRQAGAEMVEFILTLLFFFIVLFMIIDFGILMYEKGTLTDAARVGARQGSLYWINPDDTAAYCPYNNRTPRDNVCMKEEMIITAVDNYRYKLLMKFGGDIGTINGQMSGAGYPFGAGLPSTGGIYEGVSGLGVTVDLCYSYRDFGLMALLHINHPTGCPGQAPATRQIVLDSRTTLTTESRF